MSGRADLHLHTTASDGAWTPAELVDRAASVGLCAIAVTDHDTVDGIAAALERGRERGLEVIPGVELSLWHEGQEVHILGYFIDHKHDGLADTLAACREERVRRVKKIVERLSELGYSITVPEVMALAKDGSAGRPHVARVLVATGQIASVPAAFEQLLAEGRPAYVPRRRMTAEEGIALIHAAGGVAVCAHPGLLRDDGIIGELVALGLDGLEVVHSEHDADMVARYQAVARQHGLVMTGGSDCHGPGVKKDLFIGKFSIPLDWVEDLKLRSTSSIAVPRSDH